MFITRINGVSNGLPLLDIRLHARDQRHEILLAGGVHALGREAARLAESGDDRLDALQRDVCEHDALERRPALRNRRKRRTDAPRAYHENLHPAQCDANTPCRKAHRSRMSAP